MAFSQGPSLTSRRFPRPTRSTEAPMAGLEYQSPRPSFGNANHSLEPPRKRTHYEADMDWRTEPPSHPLGSINLFASNKHSDGDGAGGHDSNGRHHASSGYTTTNTPFIFHSASMEVDHPSASTSRSALDTDPAASEAGRPQSEAVEEANSNNATREIANGAVQRERRRREQKKGWQIVEASNASNKTGAAGDSEDSGNEDTLDDISHAPSAAAATSAILRRKRSRKLRDDPRQPVHFSLHNHNHHYGPGTTTQDPFVFRAGQSPKDGSLLQDPSLSLGPAFLQSARPPGWWQEEGPYILLGYLQFAFNGALVTLALYLIVSFVLIISRDIAERTHEYSIEVQQSIMHCSEQYIKNRCAPNERVPILEAKCQEWEHCMNKNPKIAIGKARIGAEIFAEIINSFVDMISWRTQLFIFTALFILIRFTNSTISSYRKSHGSYPHPPQQQQQYLSQISRHPTPHGHDPRHDLMSSTSSSAGTARAR